MSEKVKVNGKHKKRFLTFLCIFLCVVIVYVAVTTLVTVIGLKANRNKIKTISKVAYKNQLVPENYDNGCWNIKTDRDIKVVQLTDVHLGGGYLSINKDSKAINAVAAMLTAEKPDLVMIDSIQTMNLTELSSSPGSVTQVRECTNMLMRTAKGCDIPMFIVGHVNKEGSIAGPKVLEHIVDTVLHFEGDKQMSCRILRAVKNRYGSTNEIGVFEMTDKGLQEVENPSVMLLSGRPSNVSGTCVTCTIEGSRPILAETQGLATQSGYGNPRRMATGFDYNRLSLLLAVLEKRAGYYFSNYDTYINIVGGLRVDEPAIDLSVAMALISSLKDTPIDEKAVVFGEIGLAGEIRAVSQAQMRINEAVRLGFNKIILPYHNLKGVHCDDAELIGVKNIRQAFEAIS